MNGFRSFVAFIAVFAIISAGCQTRLKWSRTETIAPGETKLFDIDAPRYDQQVTIEFTADNEINVYACLQDDKDKVQDAILMGRTPTGVLASKEKSSSGSMEFSVAAKMKP